MRLYNALLIGNGTMGKRHKSRFEKCGVTFSNVLDKDAKDELTKVDNLKNNLFDFVVIASPAITHYDYVKFFLERNVSVFVEKPLATSCKDAQELVDLSLKNNTTLFVAHSECFNPFFLNFRKHFILDLKNILKNKEKGEPLKINLEFRREHKYSKRCRDVNVALDLLVHDLGLFFTLFEFKDIQKIDYKQDKNGDCAKLKLKVTKGIFEGIEASFIANRISEIDVRSISVNYGASKNSIQSEYSVNLSHYTPEGDILHVPDSMDNEHKFFLKLLAGACKCFGDRAMQTAANVVKILE